MLEEKMLIKGTNWDSEALSLVIPLLHSSKLNCQGTKEEQEVRDIYATETWDSKAFTLFSKLYSKLVTYQIGSGLQI